MAKQTVNIGGAANDGTGDPLRTAFNKLNDNFDEVYGNNFVTTNQIADDAVTTDKLADSINTEITANTAKVTNATHTGDVTGSTALTIANDAVTHDKLENRYTAKATSSTTGSQNLDASTASTFLLTGNITTATLTIQNMKLGQAIDIVLSGTLTSAVITLADDFTTSTISKVGGDLDTAETNIIQVICLDDTDSAAKLVYSINKYVTDTTP